MKFGRIAPNLASVSKEFLWCGRMSIIHFLTLHPGGWCQDWIELDWSWQLSRSVFCASLNLAVSLIRTAAIGTLAIKIISGMNGGDLTL